MKSKIYYVLGITGVIISAFFILGIKLIFPACGMHDDGTYGTCHSAGQIIFFLAIALAVFWVLFTVIRNKAARIVTSACSIVLAVVSALIPGTICRLCVMPGMRCISTMKPCTIACGAVLAILGIICLFISLKGSGKNEK